MPKATRAVPPRHVILTCNNCLYTADHTTLKFDKLNECYGCPQCLKGDMIDRSKHPEEIKVKEDTGAHYRIYFRGGKLDPYRIVELYDVPRGPMEQICKKSLRGAKKGHTLKKVFQEIIDAATRGIEMIEEDTKDAKS